MHLVLLTDAERWSTRARTDLRTGAPGEFCPALVHLRDANGAGTAPANAVPAILAARGLRRPAVVDHDGTLVGLSASSDEERLLLGPRRRVRARARDSARARRARARRVAPIPTPPPPAIPTGTDDPEYLGAVAHVGSSEQVGDELMCLGDGRGEDVQPDLGQPDSRDHSPRSSAAPASRRSRSPRGAGARPLRAASRLSSARRTWFMARPRRNPAAGAARRGSASRWDRDGRPGPPSRPGSVPRRAECWRRPHAERRGREGQGRTTAWSRR